METLIIQTEGENLAQVKAYLNKLRVPFTVQEEEPPYNPDFVAKIRESEEDYKNGKFSRVTSTEELKKLLLDE